MFLRTKIFRYLVIFALIPSIVMAVVAYYMISRAMDQAEGYLVSSSPDRTINSLRLVEDYLQQTVREYLLASGDLLPGQDSTLLHWKAVHDEGIYRINVDRVFSEDDIRTVLPDQPGPIRKVIGSNLIIGYAVLSGERLVAGGFILDREYLSGFEAVSQSLSESREYKNILPAFVLFVIAAGAIVFMAVVLAAYFLSRRLSGSITTPLERLNAFAGAMARGEKPQQLLFGGTEEVVSLSDTFNRMTAELEQSRRRLMAAERVAAWQDFARQMAHELKNPLTPISISLYRIQNKLKEKDNYGPYAEAIEAITAEVDHLERLAADYSSLAKLPEPKFTFFDFDLLISEVLELFSAQLEPFAFENRKNGKVGEIEGDPDRLREVIVNLLKNAIVFAPDKGRIIVGSEKVGNLLRFSVVNENRDKNLSEADLRPAKLPYYSTREGGSGLGLAIAEKIILDHDGTLTLRLRDGMTEAGFEIALGRQSGGDD